MFWWYSNDLDLTLQVLISATDLDDLALRLTLVCSRLRQWLDSVLHPLDRNTSSRTQDAQAWFDGKWHVINDGNDKIIIFLTSALNFGNLQGNDVIFAVHLINYHRKVVAYENIIRR